MTTATSSPLERQSAHILVSSSISVVVGLGTSVLLARALGPSGRGLLDLAGASIGLFALVLGCSIPAGITHIVARHMGLPRSVAPGLFVWGLGAGALSAGLLWLPGFAARFGLLPAATGVFWPAYIIAMVVLSTWTALLRGVLVGRHELIKANRLEVGCKVTSLLLFAGITLTAVRHEAAAYALTAATVAIANGLGCLCVLRDAQVPAIRGAWSAILGTALPLHGANVLHFLNQRIDVFFVQSARGAAEVGVYALAVSLAQFILLVSSAFSQPLLPQVSAERDARAAAEGSARVCRIYTGLGVLAATGLGLTMPVLLPRVFGAAFQPSVQLFLILLPGVIASGLTSILVSYFVGTDHPRINLFVAGAAALVTVVGNAWLTPILGAQGAALTSTTCYVLSAVLSVTCFTRVSGLAWHRLVWPSTNDWHTMATLAGRFRP